MFRSPSSCPRMMFWRSKRPIFYNCIALSRIAQREPMQPASLRASRTVSSCAACSRLNDVYPLRIISSGTPTARTTTKARQETTCEKSSAVPRLVLQRKSHWLFSCNAKNPFVNVYGPHCQLQNVCILQDNECLQCLQKNITGYQPEHAAHNIQT